ncbi:MAG TPA: cysteine--tRNA ligase [Sulfolobales archaeon]|nr:cysteine--tRNA ligase [Sulfolobales archaeon]
MLIWLFALYSLRWGLLRLYNTLTKRVEEFVPSSRGYVKTYFCGPTPYDYFHLGHARAYVSFDILKRFLMARGYSVIHVQNITDIDDKIINRSRELGISWRELADIYTKDYLDAMRLLRISIDLHPRVTDHIGDIIAFIQGLIEKGHAYVAKSGSVYFDVSTYHDYGRLSGRGYSEEWRQEEEYLAEKRNPYDFALWKAAKPGEPYWESPWGRGRPGWHIECSVMSSKYLGNEIDIHGGGQDLIFPHHENERAQSEAYFGKSPWVRHWFHVGYLTISGEKMSKSLGNIVTFKEAASKWGAEVIRLWIASASYRKSLDYKEEALEQARIIYRRIVDAHQLLRSIVRERGVEHSLGEKDIEVWMRISRTWEGFLTALEDDLDTPRAMTGLHELLSIVYSNVIQRDSGSLALKALSVLETMDKILDVLPKPEQRSVLTNIDPEDLVRLLVEVRQRLRQKKMYEESDWIREQMMKLGIKLLDEKDKTRWVYTS